ncbi:MAG: FAS1-like dehydratase domain-containing protein, partial [Steroidobacteraceae bacterium]
MPIDPRRLLAHEFPPMEVAWTERDCMLYALATGFGQDPLNERELRYVYESPDLLVSPTAVITLYYDDRWMRESGVNLRMSVHGEQRMVFHHPVPARGRARVTSRVTGIFDKGAGKG